MLTAKQETKDGVIFVTLDGSLEESVTFETLFDSPDGSKVTINCKGVIRINSVGVKFWIEFFTKCTARKVQLTFVDCSPVIVQQLNSISNFYCGAKIQSIMVPFSCEKCDVAFQQPFPLEKLIATNFALPEFKCPRCQGVLSFDDEPEEYFGCFKK